MVKEKRSFRVNKELDILLKNIAATKGLTFSQLVELACYNLVNMKKIDLIPDDSSSQNKDKKIKVSINTDEKTYQELINRVKEKNSTLSQEINFILKASLTNNSFSKFEIKELNQSIYDLNKLGNLLKLSLNNKLNTPELLIDIGTKIDKIRQEFNSIILDSSKRRIKK